MKRFGALIFLVLFIQMAYGQTTYYVSPKGNDNNKGTIKRPLKSIDQLNKITFKPGDKILFEANNVFTGSLVLDDSDASSPENPITISSYGEGKATIKTSSGNGIMVNNLSGIIIQNMIVTSHGLKQNNGYGVKIFNNKPGGSRLKMVRIENVEASEFKWAGIFVGGVPTDLPNVKSIEGSRYGFSDVQISNCVAHNNMYYGIYMTAQWVPTSEDYGNKDVIIRDCITYDNAGDSTYTANHSGSGIMVDDTENVVIEYCTSYHNGALNAGLTGGPCAIWSHASTNVLIQHCEAYNNKSNGAADGGGFDLDGGVTNSVIQYCYSHDNDGPGYLMWNYENAPHRLGGNTLRYNISANDSRKHNNGAIHIGSGGLPITDITVHNNTILIGETSEGNAKGIWVGGSAANKNFQFYNNLILTDGKVPLLDIEPNQVNFMFAGNAYWSMGASFLLKYNNVEYHSLSNWIAYGASKGINDHEIFIDSKVSLSISQQIINDPHKLSTLKNFHILPGSPLIKAGVDLRSRHIENTKKDFWRNEVSVERNPDIGAFQKMNNLPK